MARIAKTKLKSKTQPSKTRMQELRKRLKADPVKSELHLKMERKRDKERREKQKEHRCDSVMFNEYCKKKERERKRKQRAKAKSGRIDTIQKERGRKMRRRNMEDKDRLISDLQGKLERKTKLLRKMKRIDSLNSEKNKVTNNSDLVNTTEEQPANVLWQSLSPPSKKRVKQRLHITPPPQGVNSNFRESIGINLSNAVPPSSSTSSLLEQQIKDFMLREDVSKCCPDKKKCKDSEPLRYRLQYLRILHEKFIAETDSDCHYSTFCRHVPRNVVKPKPSDWGTCLCQCCLNPELKVERLTHLGYLQVQCLEDVMLDPEQSKQLSQVLDDPKFADMKTQVTYIEWQRSRDDKGSNYMSKKSIVNSSVSDLVGKLKIELERLQEHLIRVKTQYRALREARQEAQQNPEVACVQIDWSENATLFQTRQEKGAYYHDIQLCIHTGYVWTQSHAYAIASISDCTDHKAAATWASFEEVFLGFVNQGCKTLVVVSDSPTSQYRNKSNFKAMSDFALKHGIVLKWIYLEAGHGKGIPDGVGATVKRKIDDLIAFEPNGVFRCAEHIYTKLQDSTSVKIYKYTKADVTRHADELAKNAVKPIPGTMSLHEVQADPDGTFSGKDLSSMQGRKLSLQREKPPRKKQSKPATDVAEESHA